MKQNDTACEKCGSEETQDKGDGILKCWDCGAYFESDELLSQVTKARRKTRFDDDDRV